MPPRPSVTPAPSATPPALYRRKITLSKEKNFISLETGLRNYFSDTAFLQPCSVHTRREGPALSSCGVAGRSETREKDKFSKLQARKKKNFNNTRATWSSEKLSTFDLDGLVGEPILILCFFAMLGRGKSTVVHRTRRLAPKLFLALDRAHDFCVIMLMVEKQFPSPNSNKPHNTAHNTSQIVGGRVLTMPACRRDKTLREHPTVQGAQRRRKALMQRKECHTCNSTTIHTPPLRNRATDSAPPTTFTPPGLLGVTNFYGGAILRTINQG